MKLLILASLLISLHLTAGIPPAPPQFNGPTFNNNNKQTIEQNITISIDKQKLSDCSQLQGTPLKECMACQTPESFRNNLKALDDYTALAYWKNLTLREYTDNLGKFTHEQWLEFYQSRAPENQKFFLSDLGTLKSRIKRIYINAYYYWLGSFLWSGQDANKVDDLNEFIQAYEYALERGRILPHDNPILHWRFESVKNSSFGPQKRD